MRGNVFENERNVLEQAQLKAQNDPSPADYQELLAAYERLLAQSEKIVRLGDSTQKKLMRAQQMLHRALQRHRAVAEQKSELLSIITHEIRNKASPIRELTRWVAEDVQETASERSRDMLRHIEEAAEKMIESVNQTLSRESDRSTDIVPVFEWTDLTRLLEAVLPDLRVTAEKKGTALAVESSQSCEAYIDAFMIGEVFENLIGNAIKFSPPGSHIQIRLRRGKGRPCFEVQDQGPGLSHSDRARLFQRFQTLSARPTGGEASSGMGLFIVKKLADLHKATVSGENAPDNSGAIFRLELAEQPDPLDPKDK